MKRRDSLALIRAIMAARVAGTTIRPLPQIVRACAIRVDRRRKRVILPRQ